MTDVLIIGCGVTGAACAYALSRYDLSVEILERSSDVANGTSKANSAIVHAGYDPVPGTQMAALNVQGCARMPALCRQLDVPYRQCGSLVLALEPEDLPRLQRLYEQGRANGVPELRLLSATEALALEPGLAPGVLGALYAPSAGIVDPWELTLAMAEIAVENGARLHLHTAVTGIEKTPAGSFRVHTPNGDYQARYVLSAAGVDADRVRGLLEPAPYTVQPTRGQYYLLDRAEGTRVSHTVFQCPGPKGKGVLVTPTVHGNLLVGPDAVPTVPGDVATDSAGLAAVAAAALRSVPGLNLRQNIRNFAGVRANTDRNDFIIEESRAYPGFIDLAGIRSPGLTAAPAIGERAMELLARAGLELRPRADRVDRRRRVRFADCSPEEKRALIAADPAYGRVVCRCETVTEGEILAALRAPIPPTTIHGVKRRVGTGMGRCQGGFCTPKVHELLVRELGLDWLEVCLEEPGSELLAYETKGGAQK